MPYHVTVDSCLPPSAFTNPRSGPTPRRGTCLRLSHDSGSDFFKVSHIACVQAYSLLSVYFCRDCTVLATRLTERYRFASLLSRVYQFASDECTFASLHSRLECGFSLTSHKTTSTVLLTSHSSSIPSGLASGALWVERLKKGRVNCLIGRNDLMALLVPAETTC